jgi:AAA15 family ATPase/GTPase
MKGIHTLKIKNFKAFPVEQTFNFEGKHVLIYGENSSGKSSIYWALYTLLQSSIVGKKTEKYFRISRFSLLSF